MSKFEKLRLCNWMLVFATVFILASGIQLEATGSHSIVWVWIHVIIGWMFFANITWHLYLHFGWKSWGQRLWKQKTPVTRWLAVWASLSLVSAFVAFFHWVGSYVHSPIGGIHGKISFIFLILSVGHIGKRIKFFKSARNRICNA